MKKTIILIAAMAMTTLTAQANETMDAIGQAVTDAVQVTSASTDDAQQGNETNESKPEEKTPEER